MVLYLISAVIFAQTFKVANRNMKNAGSLTILLEIFTAIFAFLFIPLFSWQLPTQSSIYLPLFLMMVIYAATDRLNIEARYGLDPSVFSMMKQLSTVFIILFGFLFLGEKTILTQIIGSLIIIGANILLTFEKGKIKINKYFMMSIISNLLFALAMIINVDIADSFNLAFYTMLTVLIPACIIFLVGKHNIKDLKIELSIYKKIPFFVASLTWCIMLISSIRAYQLGNITMIAPLFALTSIINTIIELIIYRKTNNFFKKNTSSYSYYSRSSFSTSIIIKN